MNPLLRPFLTVVLLAMPTSVLADFDLIDGRYGSLQFTFNAKTAGFAEGNPWFGKAIDNIGDAANVWWEGSVEPGIKGTLNFFGGTELYGGYSYVYAQTLGHDASGLTAGLDNPGAGRTENAYAGWRSGDLIPGLDKNAIDISGGRQDYRIGTGFLVYTGASPGGSLGAYWIAPRQSFKDTVIGLFATGPVRFEGFHLTYRNRDARQKGSVYGANLEYTYGSFGTVGLTYMHGFQSDNPNLEGLNVYDVRVAFTSLPVLPKLSISGEYVFEDNGSVAQSNGGYAQISYAFDQAPWSPKLSYRYAALQGDDPNTVRDEAFNPLAYGMSDWATWYQGEIVGEYVLSNSNLLSHLLRVEATPVDSLKLQLLYYHFTIDQPQSLATGVTAADFADEIDLIADWQATQRLSISGVVAAAIPGGAARQFTGGNRTWFHGMVYAVWEL